MGLQKLSCVDKEVPGMRTDLLRVSVMSAMSGDVLMVRDYERCLCAQTLLTQMLLADLGHRPSRQFMLFMDGLPLASDFVPGDRDELSLSASISQGVTCEEKMAFITDLRHAAGKDSFREASLAVRDDPEVAMAAVCASPHALEFASPLCRNDKQIVLAAVQRDGLALCHASMFLQNDREIALVAVGQTGLALKWVGA